jgi:hypothetical protein
LKNETNGFLLQNLVLFPSLICGTKAAIHLDPSAATLPVGAQRAHTATSDHGLSVVNEIWMLSVIWLFGKWNLDLENVHWRILICQLHMFLGFFLARPPYLVGGVTQSRKMLVK